MADGPQIGDVVVAFFPVRDPRGHEQEGLRPSVVVGLPDVLGPAWFPLLVVVPFTTFRGQDWATTAPERYPQFEPGTGGLRSASVVLLDQVVAIDVSRIRSSQGALEPEQYDRVREGLERMFGLQAKGE